MYIKKSLKRKFMCVVVFIVFKLHLQLLSHFSSVVQFPEVSMVGIFIPVLHIKKSEICRNCDLTKCICICGSSL